MKNQYKDQLSSISPSEAFKRNLKDMMAKEFANQATTIIHEETGCKFNWTKYSRYIACAACIAMIVATIGVTSAINGGFRSLKSYDAAENESTDISLFMNGTDSGETESVVEDSAEDPSPRVEDEPAEEVDDDIDITAEEEASETEEYEYEVEEDAAVESAEDDISWDTPMSSIAASKSAYAPENYDGEYYAEDYVYVAGGSGSTEALSVWDSEDTDVSYNDVCNDILSDLGQVGLIKFDIKEIVASDMANSITGSDSFADENTLYKVELVYDYLTNESADGEIYVSCRGNEIVQEKGFPMFEVGDTVLAVVEPGESYCRMIEQLVYEVHRVSSIDIGYHLVYGNVDPGYTDMGLLDMERSVVTSTSNNPAEYTNKVAVKELTRYLRRNLKKREIGFADMTTAEEITGNVVVDTPIVDDPIQEGSLSMKLDDVKFTVGGMSVTVGMDGAELADMDYFSENSILDSGMSVAAIGKNMILFDGAKAYTGKVVMVEVNESGSPLPMKLNGFTVGADWAAAVSALGISISPEDDQICDIEVVSGNDILYRITITVEKGTVKSILLNGMI